MRYKNYTSYITSDNLLPKLSELNLEVEKTLNNNSAKIDTSVKFAKYN